MLFEDDFVLNQLVFYLKSFRWRYTQPLHHQLENEAIAYLINLKNMCVIDGMEIQEYMSGGGTILIEHNLR